MDGRRPTDAAAAAATRQYLKSHRLEATLNELVVLLVLDRPADPWACLADRLDALSYAGGKAIATGLARARTMPPPLQDCTESEADAHREVARIMQRRWVVAHGS
jgi:hypothetical protein